MNEQTKGMVDCTSLPGKGMCSSFKAILQHKLSVKMNLNRKIFLSAKGAIIMQIVGQSFPTLDPS